MTLIVAGFLFRLIDIQFIQAETLSEKAVEKRAVPEIVPSIRGQIVDRDGIPLATSEERYDVQLSPKNTRVRDGSFYRENEAGENQKITRDRAYEEIGAITGQSAEEIRDRVDAALKENPKSDFAYVKRSIDLASYQKLKKLQVPWLTFDSQHKRRYPAGAVGGNIIGFAGQDEKPQEGVELSQNKCLTGEDGRIEYERSPDGVKLPGSIVETKKVRDGGTVKLTLKRDLQWQAQQTINAATQKIQAEWGLAVVMDARTGELVAVAEDGSVDPGDVSATPADRRGARSFVAPYEPGSTFKTITAAILLDQGVATPATRNLTPDHIEPEPHTGFGDFFHHAPRQWTLAGIITNSSNVGIATLGNQIPRQTRYDYLKKFGLGQATQAGMPLEDGGLLYPPENWDPQTSYTTMFGQGLSATIVQTAGVYQTIANGGLRIPPSVVTSCTTANGKTQTLKHGEKQQVISPEAAQNVTRMLENVTHQKWITPLIDIPGYRIAGKTGTAEQSDGKGSYRADYVHSFAGFFPAENPRYVIVTSLAFPAKGDGTYESVRVFHDIAEATIRTFSVPPSTGSYEKLPEEY